MILIAALSTPSVPNAVMKWFARGFVGLVIVGSVRKRKHKKSVGIGLAV